MAGAFEDCEGTVSIGGRTITNLRFADDIDGLAGQEQELVQLVNHLEEASSAYDMQIGAEKSQLMTYNTNGISTDIATDNKKLETVRSFKYLGAKVSVEGSKSGILPRTTQTTVAVTKLQVIWNNKDIAISFKIRLMRSLVRSIFLNACKTRTTTAGIERRIQVLEMRCFGKLLSISYRDHITNEEVKTRIGHAIGPYGNLLTSVKTEVGDVIRSSGLAKTILEGKEQGGRRRGRQRKRWEDNTKEWTGLETNSIMRKAENRE